jgi:hypothetical protein
MSIKLTIETDLKSSMKNADHDKVGILRLLLSAIHNEEIAKRSKGEEGVLIFEEEVAVLRREAKKRKESIELYRQGDRTDLAEKEEWELKAIGQYLPPEMSREAVEEVVRKVIAAGSKDFGTAMKESMKELKGQADGKLVAEVIKSLLQTEQ